MEAKTLFFLIPFFILTLSNEIDDKTREKLGNILNLKSSLIFSGDGISESCKRSSQEFYESLNNLELWALKMFDASAKLPSGLLSGNINQFGDFDECLDVVAKSEKFRGKYCLAHFQPHISSNSTKLIEIKNLILSSEIFPSTFDDITQFFPKLSQFGFAFCIPSRCSYKELELVLTKNLQDFFMASEIHIDVRVNEDMCQVSKNFWTPSKASFTGLSIIVATIWVCFSSKSFLIRKNWQMFLSTQTTSTDITCVHGIRFFTTITLIYSHKTMEIHILPLWNHNYFKSLGKLFTANVICMSLIYTDILLCLSALLTSYTLISSMRKGKKVQIWREILRRYLRLVPVMAAVMILDTFILPIVANGPQYSTFIGSPAKNCQNSWWLNFLMIQNWFGLENTCVPQTYHVAVDFQLTIIGIILSKFLNKQPKRAKIAIFTVTILSTLARFYVSYTQELSLYFYNGIRTSKIFEFFNLINSNTFLRFPTYAIGILLGHYLQNCRNIVYKNRNLEFLCAIAIFLFTFGWTAFINKENLQSALFSTWAPILICFSIALFIYITQLGHKSLLTSILEWKFFVITSKLSYLIMLLHFSIFHFNHARVRTSIEYGITSVINAYELICIVIAAIFFLLFIDIPFENLRKKIMK